MCVKQQSQSLRSLWTKEPSQRCLGMEILGETRPLWWTFPGTATNTGYCSLFLLHLYSLNLCTRWAKEDTPALFHNPLCPLYWWVWNVIISFIVEPPWQISLWVAWTVETHSITLICVSGIHISLFLFSSIWQKDHKIQALCQGDSLETDIWVRFGYPHQSTNGASMPKKLWCNSDTLHIHCPWKPSTYLE